MSVIGKIISMCISEGDRIEIPVPTNADEELNKKIIDSFQIPTPQQFLSDDYFKERFGTITKEEALSQGGILNSNQIDILNQLSFYKEIIENKDNYYSAIREMHKSTVVIKTFSEINNNCAFMKEYMESLGWKISKNGTYPYKYYIKDLVTITMGYGSGLEYHRDNEKDKYMFDFIDRNELEIGTEFYEYQIEVEL